MQQIGEILGQFKKKETEDKAVPSTRVLPDDMRKDHVSRLSDVRENVERAGSLLSEGWFPLSRQILARLIDAPTSDLRLYCWLANNSVKTYKIEHYYYGYPFEEVEKGTVLVRLGSLAAWMSVSEAFAKRELIRLLKYGYLDILVGDSFAFGYENLNDSCADSGWRSELIACHLTETRGGWVKVPNAIFGCRPELFRLLVWLYHKARGSNNKKTASFKGKTYVLERGMFLATNEEIGDSLGLNRFQVRRYAKQAMKQQFLRKIPNKGEKSFLWHVSQ